MPSFVLLKANTTLKRFILYYITYKNLKLKNIVLMNSLNKTKQNSFIMSIIHMHASSCRIVIQTFVSFTQSDWINSKKDKVI